MGNTLDDIFNDDAFGLLNEQDKQTNAKSDQDRLGESFEEINDFYEKNQREPSMGSMSEYSLCARLKSFRNDDAKKKVLKPLDRFNLLGHVEMETPDLEKILKDDDMGLLTPEGDVSIFDTSKLPKKTFRAKTDFVAQRDAIPDEVFKPYEILFQQVQKDLKTGKRKLIKFENTEKNLQIGHFYLLDGILLLLESGDLAQELKGDKSGGRIRIDGRTNIIFENATQSNMLYRSLGKALQKSGKLITDIEDNYIDNLKNTPSYEVNEDDAQSGWIYILKSKSTNSQLSEIRNLYKIGFSTVPVLDRIKNAKKEATYIYSEVEIIATYHCYNLNIHHFENLLHRFLGECCLNVDLYNADNQRYIPREWFIVPLSVIDEAIHKLIDGSIVYYRYDKHNREIVIK